jgi:NAD-dependent dihydropyrimidine dehydrogenase PreA subunit
MEGLRYLRNVVTLNFDVEKCIGCDRCVEVCPHAVFSMGQKGAQVLDRDACMECGACAINCPVEAITVRSGVGCAAHILNGAFGGNESDCGCSGSS